MVEEGKGEERGRKGKKGEEGRGGNYYLEICFRRWEGHFFRVAGIGEGRQAWLGRGGDWKGADEGLDFFLGGKWGGVAVVKVYVVENSGV